jgi:signal transduction histidine kinase/ActR/RegA family two-component response regulator/HPt (histidine-containing phosphotransfer) domain-containing protein
MKRSFYLKTKVLLGFGLILLAILGASVIAYQSYEQLSEAVRTISQPDPKLQQIDSIMFTIGKSETNLQQYTITKSRRKLSEYDSLVSHIRDRVQRLKEFSAYDESELDSILNLINAKLVSMDKFMQLRDQRDAFRFYDKALQQLQEEDNRASIPAADSVSKITRTPPQLEITESSEDELNSEEEKKGLLKKIRGWFANRKEVQDSLSQEDVVSKADSMQLDDKAIANMSVDSVRQMLLRLKSEQAATERYLDQQELDYLANNARVMNRINELVAEVKQEQQAAYREQSQEARTILETSLSRLGLILLIALGSTFLFVYLIFADITKSDFLKDQLEKAKASAEQLARVKEDFLANMSHEIRTPLTAILGFSGLLKDSSLDEKQAEYLRAVDSSSTHLLSLVNDILDFSKIEAGQLRFEREPFDIFQMMEQVCNDMRIQAEKKDLQIIYETEGEDFRYVEGDAFRLRQVLYNLISNAIKFTEEGGVIVRCKLKPIDEATIKAQLEVTDTGIGIPLSKQKHIFDAFVQSDVSDTRKYGGTGLGLSICKKIVEAQGGEVDLESTVGEGSTFYLALPFGKSKAEAVAATEMADEKLVIFPGFKVLVIDDDPLNTKLISLMLGQLEAECLVAHSGAEGLGMLEQEKVHLVLTDLQMPEMHGEEVVAAVRTGQNAMIPVLAFTARVTENQDYFSDKGFNGVLHKPFRQSDVVRVLYDFGAEFQQSRFTARQRPQALASSTSEKDPFFTLSGISRFIGDDQEAMLQFIESFMGVLKDGLVKVDSALAENDPKTIGYYAHKLYPNVAQLQVADLPAVLRKLENHAKEEKVQGALTHETAEFIRLGNRLLTALEKKREALIAGVS